jgi:2-dehydropantoate 2-reductase
MKKRIAVIGIGGIGGYIGFNLANYYKDNDLYEIVFVQRKGKHFDEIEKNGLTFIKDKACITFPNLITDNPSSAGIFDIVIFCTKSTDLENSARSVKNNVNKNTVFVSTLNGVNNAKRLKEIFPNNTLIDGCIYIASHISKPGTVQLEAVIPKLFIGNFDGNSEREHEVEKIMQNANINAILTDNIVCEIWKKYIFVCSIASVTSLYNVPIGGIVEKENILSVWINLMKEEVQLAQKESINIKEGIIQSFIDRAKSLPYESKSSMQIDIERAKPTEIDIFAGYIVNRGKELQIPVPYHEEVYGKLIKFLKTCTLK